MRRTQAEAVAAGLFWFTRWDGTVIEETSLEQARQEAFEECVAVIHGHYDTEEIPTHTCITVVVFLGLEDVATITVNSNIARREPLHGWSPPEWPVGELYVSPEEYAHLVQRRIARSTASMKGAP